MAVRHLQELSLIVFSLYLDYETRLAHILLELSTFSFHYQNSSNSRRK